MYGTIFFLIRKASQATASDASLRYAYAMRHGSPADRRRETLRRAIREILGIWVLSIVPTILLLDAAFGWPDDHSALLAIPLCFFASLPLWIAYRVLRFALVR